MISTETEMETENGFLHNVPSEISQPIAAKGPFGDIVDGIDALKKVISEGAQDVANLF